MISNDHLRAAFARSRARSSPSLPRPLLDAIAAFCDRGAHTTEDYKLIWKAFREVFPFLPSVYNGGPAPNSEELDTWADFLSWIIGELTNWSAEHDPEAKKLRALFLLMGSDVGTFWSELPDEIGGNEALMGAVTRIIIDTRIVCLPRRPSSIASQEVLDQFNAADAAGDWVSLSETMPDDIGYSDFVLGQAALFLRRFDFSQLITATGSISQSAVAATIAQALGMTDALELALRTNNQRQKFLCLFQHFHNLRSDAVLSPHSRSLLAQVLVQASSDELTWRAWMRVFNQYPVRFPALQAALGIALASASEAAIRTYVETPVLHTSPHKERLLIAECLSAFRDEADSSKRRVLWTVAYERWKAWDFGRYDERPSLFEISRSALDYAVVGYALECMTIEDRKRTVDEIIQSVCDLDKNWHINYIDVISTHRRLLSRMQPYCHAMALEENGESGWITETRIYEISVGSGDDYYRMKYGVR